MLLAMIALVMLINRKNSPAHLSEPSTSHIASPVVDDRLAALETLATTQHDLAEAKRVLNDAQSGLAERDREIAAANDELRRLRQALSECRAKAIENPAKAP
jgi:uncharacterized coiled-coil protein SlyX